MRCFVFEYKFFYDVIVVGGGHAGVEAAHAAARMGKKTLLIEFKIDQLGMMSCNPAIGGIGKTHLVKELDVLGGIMAQAADRSGIHARVLNASKGPAVRATRLQTDRQLYRRVIREFLDDQDNLSLVQSEVEDVLVENDCVVGVQTTHAIYRANKVVLTCGTFLSGLIHMGDTKIKSGRAGDIASNKLSVALRRYPLRFGRLKTGTPPRLDGRSIDFTKLEKQPSQGPICISFFSHKSDVPQQVECYITRTNENTHQIISDHLYQSAMYSGEIVGVGPRYCPSIEDKVVRFAQRKSHTVFLEPEGLTVSEFYPNGLSNSLPYEVQISFIQSIDGLEKTHITRPGYAIEYDYFDPRDLLPTLESRYIKGLFLAGQINGTTGYEEAAAQGIVAGINAASCNKEPFVLSRKESYIGVMIDDLITRGTDEPYRMFTSRAENRLHLREDNAHERLFHYSQYYGLLDDAQLNLISKCLCKENSLKEKIKNDRWRQHDDLVLWMKENNLNVVDNCMISLVKRPEFSAAVLVENESYKHFSDVIDKVFSDMKYEGYVNRQAVEDKQQDKMMQTLIPPNINWDDIPGLSNEIKQKLYKHVPQSLQQAQNISGMTPAALSLIYLLLKRSK